MGTIIPNSDEGCDNRITFIKQILIQWQLRSVEPSAWQAPLGDVREGAAEERAFKPDIEEPPYNTPVALDYLGKH